MAPTVESNPFMFLGFRLVTSVSLISKVHSSRDLHLSFCLKAAGASQSAGRPESVLDFWGVTVGRAVCGSFHQYQCLKSDAHELQEKPREHFPQRAVRRAFQPHRSLFSFNKSYFARTYPFPQVRLSENPPSQKIETARYNEIMRRD